MEYDSLNRQVVESQTDRAFSERHFCAYYQPQYNHSTGRMVGAEALARWRRPEYGTLSPADFIPVFEENGTITRLDLYIFEEICKFLRKCIDEALKIVPISLNASNQDLHTDDFIGNMERIRIKYEIPVKYLRVEITENAVFCDYGFINDKIKEFQMLGYVVEMDDFGSGYSSLNALKEMTVDYIKLDMAFFRGNIGGRGGVIISSIIRMAHWLGMPIIAEGVETIEQADYMKSIGCDYIQGYLYSRPVPEETFFDMLENGEIDRILPKLCLIDSMDAEKFWNPESLETMVFNNFVGGAAIISYEDGKIEVLRVNEKYLSEFGMNMSQKDVILANNDLNLDEENRKTYIDTIRRAIDSKDEEECETWRKVHSSCCGEDIFCIRSTMRLIGHTRDCYLFYVRVNDITNEKKTFEELAESEKKFHMGAEHAGIYAWEFNLVTREMRPCARCMRDLNLPRVLENYPEPLIENGFFPADYADFYRNWLKQLDNGAESLETVMPLTAERIPFRVSYTAEFDENGHPYKAYGSAAPV